jgi:CysZ protein
MHRLGYLGLRALPILVMFPIPGINLVAAALWMVFGAWSMALEYLSYPLDNLGLKFAAQKEFLRGRRGEVLVFGGLVLAGLAVPVFNILVPPAAVAGAALYCAARKNALPAG